ncbi:polysaccharide deacetylase family protein [Seonamhaeicola marinus]|uniref:Polysaccharide deacetylase family protein n=1 Tax=Seonamhaeicola marinus TaxID=1912246 RepID=A0A5D0HT33_9FLAO|nr:polysaccharide deacetylase family protein [Seonamhaeicola marinus]TYA74533.1 polysaccharide deacetylase family protein [Seonamhaeicola marinus]
MGLVPVKTPKFLKRLFPNYIWDLPNEDKVLYLTFDDGPTPEITHWVLNILNSYNAKATFFCIGANIDKHPDIFQSILKEGHSIGNHTYNHLKGWKTEKEAYLKNVSACDEVFKSQIATTESSSINLFRPPYGKITNKQGKALIKQGYKIIMWDILSFDWDTNLSEAACLKNVINKSKSGSIIVFHDSKKSSKNMMYALPKVLEHFSGQGYTFKAIY